MQQMPQAQFFSQRPTLAHSPMVSQVPQMMMHNPASGAMLAGPSQQRMSPGPHPVTTGPRFQAPHFAAGPAAGTHSFQPPFSAPEATQQQPHVVWLRSGPDQAKKIYNLEDKQKSMHQ
jgi:hypothetical protein